MYRSFSSLLSNDMQATDKRIGKVYDMYIDDFAKEVRYVVTQLGVPVIGQRKLLAPAAIKSLDKDTMHLNVASDKVENSPDWNIHLPVSREYETRLLKHYQLAPYWSAAAQIDHPSMHPPVTPIDEGRVGIDKEVIEKREGGESYLRSLKEIKGYYVVSSDGKEVGICRDFIIDTESWGCIAFVYSQGSLFNKEEYVLPVNDVKKIRFTQTALHIDLTEKQQLEHRAAYDEHAAVNSRTKEVEYDFAGKEHSK